MSEGYVLEGRECAGCTLCCKLFDVAPLAKPHGEYCRHCVLGRGCGIYETRPQICGEFYCAYQTWRGMGAHWYPIHSKMVVRIELNGAMVAVHVDPDHPDAWLQQPYHSDLKKWAAAGARTGCRILVHIGRRTIVVLPDRDIDVGLVADDEQILVLPRSGPQGVRLDAVKVKADDPRLAGVALGKPISEAPRGF